MAKHWPRHCRTDYLKQKRELRKPYLSNWKLLFCACGAPPCAAAHAIDGTVCANGNEPVPPLVGCDTKECLCGFVLLTPEQALRRGAK